MASARIFLQWTVIVYNTLSVIFGILAIVACVFTFDDGALQFTEKIVQLAAAAVLVISAFVGCCGAVNGSIKTLCVFIAILLALVISHVWILLRYDEAKQLSNTQALVTYTWLEELVKPGEMNDLQERHECCGKKNYIDYTSLGLQVPNSCYRIKDGLRSVYPHGEGCMSAVTGTVLRIYRYEKLAHWSFMGFEGLGILLSLLLICKLTVKTRKYNY